MRFFVFRSCKLGAMLSSISDLPYQRTEIEVFGTPILCIDEASLVVRILGRLLSELALAGDPAHRIAALLNERRVLFELLFCHSE